MPLLPLSELRTKLSFWAASLLAIVALAEPHWPLLRENLPSHWVEIGAVVIVIARAIRQHSSGPPPSDGDKPGSPPASTPSRTRGGLASFLVACLLCVSGCGLPAPKLTPEQGQCQADAELEKDKAFAACEALDTASRGSCEKLDAINCDYCVAMIECVSPGDGETECKEECRGS